MRGGIIRGAAGAQCCMLFVIDLVARVCVLLHSCSMDITSEDEHFSSPPK